MESSNQKKSRIDIKGIFSRILLLLFVAAVASYLYSSFRVKKQQQYLPTVFGVTGVTIETGSMAPEARVGDYVLITLPREDQIEKGDIITFVDEDILVTHRVARVIDENGRKGFSTKGDANNTVDENIVYIDDVVGVCFLVIPKLGVFLKWITSTTGMIIVGGIILILLFLPDKKKKQVKVTT